MFKTSKFQSLLVQWGSKSEPLETERPSKRGLFKAEILNGSVFEWSGIALANGYSSGPDHSKTNRFEIRTNHVKRAATLS